MIALKANVQKAVVVTGGAGGIGKALSLRLARDGYFVYVCCHENSTAGSAIVDLIQSESGAGELLTFDVSDGKAAERCLDLVCKGPYAVTSIVHAAGIVRKQLFIKTSQESWDAVLSINLSSFFYCVRPLLRSMILAREGSIVAISSGIAQRGLECQSAYAASKAGLTGAVRTLAREVGPYNIRANIVSPGWINAGMNQDVPLGPIQERIPLRRAGTAEEVAEVVSFLCSTRASYITGADIPVTGGLEA